MLSIHPDGFWYGKGDIAIVQEEYAEHLIEEEIAEPFSYSMTDEEILRLYKKQNEEYEFDKKVDLLVEILLKESHEIYLESDPSFILEDGTILSFEVRPETPAQWFYYNTSLSELYSKKYPIFKIEDFIIRFQRSLKNYNYPTKRKEVDIVDIKKFIDKNDPEGLKYWYDQVVHGMVPKDKTEWEAFFSKKIQYGLEVFLNAKAVAEFEGLLKEPDIKRIKKSSIKDEQSFTIVNIKLEKLVVELYKRNYFENSDIDKVLEWFRGNKPEKPIDMNVNSNHFISLIADLWDIRPKIIKNTKKFCYSYIHESFLFKGKRVELNYIEKVMKPNNENRVTSEDKTIPDIQSFKT